MHTNDPPLEPESTVADPVPAEPADPAATVEDSAGTYSAGTYSAGTYSAGTSAPPSIADGVPRSLDPRSLTLARVGSAIRAAIFSLVLLVPFVIVPLAVYLPEQARPLLFLVWAGVSLALGVWLYRWPAVQHRHAAYVLDPQGIEIRRGVVWRKVIHVPRSRVQHTDVSQGPLERAYGLGTLVLYTAGTQYAKVELGGLAYETALAIRDHFVAGDGRDAV